MSMPSRSRASSGPLIAGTLIVVVIGIAIVALALAGITPQRAWDSFFPVGGQAVVTDRAHDTRALYDIVFYIAAAIFLIVEGLIIFTAIRYRRKPDDNELPPQTHGNNLVEVIWTVIPLVIVLVLFGLSWSTLNAVDAKADPGGVYVRAVAARFQWKFDYLDGPDGIRPDGSQPKVLYEQLLPGGDAGGLVLPVGQQVHVTLTSPDVIHAFYVPKFLFKRDVVPGKLNNFDFTIDTPGTYRGQCAELCGEFHGSMLFDVHALPQADFEAWFQKAQQSPPPPPSAAPPASGAPAPSGAPAGQVVQLEAKNIAFVQGTLSATAGAPFTIHFQNSDNSVPHDVKISDASGTQVFLGDPVTGPGAIDYQVPALAQGSYPFVCTFHPSMTGTITVQ
jgi:cytochrome c oxidase subunit II